MAKRSTRSGPRMRKLEPADHKRLETVVVETEPKKTNRVKRALDSLHVLKPLAIPFKLVGRILSWLLPRYLINAWRELKLVTWPSRRESWRLTGAVFVFAIIFGVLATIVDRSFDEIFRKTVLK